MSVLEQRKKSVRVSPQLYRAIKSYIDGEGKGFSYGDMVIGFSRKYGVDKTPGRKTMSQIARSKDFANFREIQMGDDLRIKNQLMELSQVVPIVEQTQQVEVLTDHKVLEAILDLKEYVVRTNQLLSILVSMFQEAWFHK